MVKNLITALIAVLFIIIGGGAGYLLRSAGGGGDSTAAKADSHADVQEKAHGDAADAKDAGVPASPATAGAKDETGAGAKAGEPTTYFKFSREFVVPLITNERVSSLVILNINLEVDSRKADKLFQKEPILRDTIMTTLIGIAGDGRTFQTMTSIENYETLRSMIALDLQKRLPDDGILNVLILDLARQDL